MRIKANLEDRFVPEFNGNKDLPADEQIVVTLQRPTTAQREGLKGYQIEAGTSKIQISFSTDKILRNHVLGITNLEDEFNGAVKEIRNGVDLAASKNPALQRLVDEIKAEVTRDYSLSEEELGNSE